MSLFTAQDGLLIGLILCKSQEHSTDHVNSHVIPRRCHCRVPYSIIWLLHFFLASSISFWDLQRGDINIPFRTKQSTVIILSPSISHEFLY